MELSTALQLQERSPTICLFSFTSALELSYFQSYAEREIERDLHERKRANKMNNAVFDAIFSLVLKYRVYSVYVFTVR